MPLDSTDEVNSHNELENRQSIRSGGKRTFNQTERITTRLKDLVRSYPKGLALIKEFLQNADDAGATDLRVIYDRRTHNGSFQDSPGMEVALGPALLFFNDRWFTEEDFEGIQRIGEGSKARDAARTGRFGQGFNTCYSVSDHPSLMTRIHVGGECDQNDEPNPVYETGIAWFDPHQRVAFQDEDDIKKNAYAWDLWYAQERWHDWVKTFAPAPPHKHWDPKSNEFPGTVFRLPLRSAEDVQNSEILKETFLDQHFDEILKEIQKVGPALLVFLRSVLSLEIREIDVNGNDRLRYWIATNDGVKNFSEKRKVLRDAVHGNPQECLEQWKKSQESLPIVQFDHPFYIFDIDGTEREETWAVTTGLFRGIHDELLDAALEVWQHEEKAIPWAGAAFCKNPTSTAQRGGLACFLPLPEEINRPVWLHGWFDLHSSRKGITRTRDVGEATQARYAWNRALMEHAVGPAWALLIEQIRGSAEVQTKPYDLWPKPEPFPDELDQALLTGFYRTAAKLPVIRGRDANGYRWCRLHDGVKDLPSKWYERLLLPLQAEGWTLCNPSLPDFVEKGFRAAAYRPPAITPATLRDDLRGDLNATDLACTLAEVPRPMLTQREWIYALAEFCADGNWKNLERLPLALLADDRLHTFTLCGTVYWIKDEERVLLAPLPARILDPEFQKQLDLKEPESQGQGVIRLNLTGLIKCITEILGNEQPIDKKKWLSAVFKYLKNCSADAIKCNEQRLKELELVPDQSGCWHVMGQLKTPLIPSHGQTKELHQALTSLNIAILDNSSKKLTEAIREFKKEHHHGFICELTQTEVAEYLHAHVTDSTTLNETALDDHEKVLRPLLEFLVKEDWLKKDDKRLPSLRKARILLTVRGERISADTKNLYLLGDFEPPAGVGAELRILYTNSNDSKWKDFFKALGVKTLSGDRFIEEALLPSFASATSNERLVYLTWLRDNYKKISDELPSEKREQLRRKIMENAIIPIKGEKLAIPKTVYYPEEKEPKELLGDIACFPDIKFKKFTGSIEESWQKFFDDFELPKRPLAKDLIEAIKALVEESKAKNVAAVRKQIQQIIVHLNERWDELKKQNNHLDYFLSYLAWLPALSKEDHAKYAEYGNWPDRLYKPRDLIPSRLGHLAASVHPILDGMDFSYLANLDLRTRVELKEVLKHFNKVIEVPITDSNHGVLWQAATAAYRFFGDAPETYQIRALSNKPCVYVNGVWHRPDRCFFNVPVKTRWTIPLQNTGLGTESIAEKKGLEKMGVKNSPDQEYWLMVLQQLSKEHGDHSLPKEPDREEARLALRELRSCSDDWLSQHDIPVLLQDGRLKSARLAFIKDDPRLEQQDKCLGQLPLIETGDSTDIATRVGEDRSLKRALKSRLKEHPQTTQNADLIKFTKQIQERIRSMQFSESLHRILYDTDYSSRALFPDFIEQVQSLNLYITESIYVESFVVIEGQEIIAFSQDNATSFLDKPSCCLWLLSKGKTERAIQESIQDEVAKNLCHIHGLHNEILLVRLLNEEPDRMLDFLDEKGIAKLPDTEQKEFKYQGTQEPEDLAAPPPPEDRDQFATAPLLDEPAGNKSSDDEPADDESSATGPGFASSVGPQAGPTEPIAKSTGERPTKPKTKDQTAKEPPVDRRDLRWSTPSTHPELQEEVDLPQPRPDTTSPKISRDAMQFRLRTYVHHQTEDACDNDDEESTSEAQEIGDAGEKFVTQQEQALGWTVTRMPKNHEGYDLESTFQGEIRYIEVKSTRGAWGNRGVPVSHPQYEAALKYGEAWWLYVVEYVDNADQPPVIHRIQNPFNRVTEFRFDGGWRHCALKNFMSREKTGFVPGAKVNCDTHGLGTIKNSKIINQSTYLDIDFGDDFVIPVLFDPEKIQLVDELSNPLPPESP